MQNNAKAMQNLDQNKGVLIRTPLLSDWRAGGESGITFKEIQSDGQWDRFLPTGERQRNASFDFFACVSFSALNVIEMLMNRMMSYQQFNQENLLWLRDNGYFDENGKFNLSDRFTAKMSGTTHAGNYLTAVGDSIRNHGVVPEKDWPTTEALTEWDLYYSEIPQEIKCKALEFRKRFEAKYEWVLIGTPSMALLKSHLKQSPLQLATATCSPWNTDEIIAGCGIATNHGTVLYGYTKDYWKDFDSYNPWCKKFANDYGIAWALKYVIGEREPVLPKETKFEYTFINKIRFGERSEDVVALQTLLKIDGVFPKAVDCTGYYGSITQKAVLDFCKKYKVASTSELDYVNGRWCGTKTLAELNKQIKLLK